MISTELITIIDSEENENENIWIFKIIPKTTEILSFKTLIEPSTSHIFGDKLLSILPKRYKKEDLIMLIFPELLIPHELRAHFMLLKKVNTNEN